MLRDRGRGRGRIGAMVPSSNRNLEPDFVLLAPEGVSVHFVRIPTGDLDALPDSEALEQYANTPVEEPARFLKDATVDVIAYGCTSATLSGTPEFDAELRTKIETLSGLPTVTAAGSLIEALEVLDISRVAFASPYVRELHGRALKFLSASGLEVVSEADVGRDLGNYEQEMSPSAVYRLGREADSAAADALVLSCTEMRAVEAIEALERDLNKPVVTSNQALVFACLRRLDVSAASVREGGRLYQSMPTTDSNSNVG